ncbi:MAG TPA: ATP-binding protein, partial [Chitinophagaceae bacterium]
SNVVRDKYLKDAGPEARQYMDRVIKASARMTKLINDLLSFTRLSVSSHFEKIDLNIILDEVLSDLELAIGDKKALITVSDLPEVEIITGQMRQVFQNLISNSLKFSKKNVVPEISITGYLVDKLDFESKPTKNGKYIRITLTDNGIGFDNRYADKIFTIFQRLHAREKYDGTGIGLAITKKIIDKHNGIIRAESVENEGSSFVIISPREQEMELLQPVNRLQAPQ